MPDKRRLVTSKVCFGSKKAGLLDHSYNKCALVVIHLRLMFNAQDLLFTLINRRELFFLY